jgi:hypothetical protein
LSAFWDLGAADVAEIERAIQLAIAPAFLLTGIFGALNVLVGRLDRLIERERAIRSGAASAMPAERRQLARRASCIHRSVFACLVAAILLCSLIVLSFAGVFLGLRVALPLALLLIAAMLAMVTALVLFLAELGIASRHLPLSGD